MLKHPFLLHMPRHLFLKAPLRILQRNYLILQTDYHRGRGVVLIIQFSVLFSNSFQFLLKLNFGCFNVLNLTCFTMLFKRQKS
uniref:Uncharacterized protein n=1 Tax=Setaria italica TaxID=4555 RepID=K3ZBB4_SETIT